MKGNLMTISTITRSSAATEYSETLAKIGQFEDELLKTTYLLTKEQLKELGKLHRQASKLRGEIFRAWNREEPIVPLKKKPFWKKFWK